MEYKLYGAAYNSNAVLLCRSASRDFWFPSLRRGYFGFRLVLKQNTRV